MMWRFDEASLDDFKPVPDQAAAWLSKITADDQYNWVTSARVLVGDCPDCGEALGARHRGQYGVQCHNEACRSKIVWERLDVVPDPDKQRGRWRGTGEGLLILGPVGTGKTHLAAALKNRLEAEKVECLFVAAMDLAWRSRQAIGDPELPDPYHETAHYPGVLVLDDFGAVKYVTASGEPTHAHDGIAHVLRHRYDYLRPTVLTAHQSLSKLAEHVGIGIASRLQQMMRVELKGSDRRAIRVAS